MLAELVTTIAKLAEQGSKHRAEVKPHPTDPDQQMVIKDDGTVDFLAAPRVPGDRHHQVHSFADLVKAYADLTEPGEDEARATIWHNDEEVVFYIDYPYMRDSVVLSLVYSEVWKTVCKFETKQTYDQKDLVRLLRHDLKGKVADSVLMAFRTLNFEVLKRNGASIQHGATKLDADLQANVQQASDKPDGFDVRFDMLSMFDLQVPAQVGITIDIDAEFSKIVLQALPDSLTLCRDRLRVEVGKAIANALANAELTGVTVIAGTP